MFVAKLILINVKNELSSNVLKTFLKLNYHELRRPKHHVLVSVFNV